MEVALDAVGPAPRETTDFNGGSFGVGDTEEDIGQGWTQADPEPEDYEPLVRRPRLSLPIFEGKY